MLLLQGEQNTYRIHSKVLQQVLATSLWLSTSVAGRTADGRQTCTQREWGRGDKSNDDVHIVSSAKMDTEIILI